VTVGAGEGGRLVVVGGTGGVAVVVVVVDCGGCGVAVVVTAGLPVVVVVVVDWVGCGVGGIVAEVIDVASEGLEMSVPRWGVAPTVQVQSGSPNSSPLLCPSPSLSASQSALVQVRPAALKAFPKAFLVPPPCRLTCPRPGWFGTFPPFGNCAWYC
jgi:hypothetical protein